MRSFYKFKNDYVFGKLDEILLKYKDDLETFDAKIGLHFSYPILQPSLRSDNAGYQYYNCTLEGNIDDKGNFIKFLHFGMMWCSSCYPT